MHKNATCFLTAACCMRASSVYREAFLTTGYSPFLTFAVPDLQGTLQRILPMGGEMDGSIQFTQAGKVVAIRSPDGHMMSLFEAEAPVAR